MSTDTPLTPGQLTGRIASRLKAVAGWVPAMGDPETAEGICASLESLIADAQELWGRADAYRTLPSEIAESARLAEVMSHLDEDPHEAAVAAVHEEIEHRKGDAR